MGSLLPLRSESRPTPEKGTRVVGVADDAADEVFEAMAAATTREVLSAVYREPGTATEIADRVDTSLQNATYHLEKLQDVELIEVGDTWYSENGNEMKVYTPTNESVVMVAGSEATRSRLREALGRLLGSVGLLAVASLLVEQVVEFPGQDVRPTDDVTFEATSGDYQIENATMVDESAEQATPAPESTGVLELLSSLDVGGLLSPGVLFFLGGLAALLLVGVWTYRAPLAAALRR